GFSDEDLVGLGTWSPPLRDFLARAVNARLNILVTGGTGSGKTTTLNALSSFVPSDERIVTIEDTLELRLRQPHVVRLEARPPSVEGRGEATIRRLVRNALRMRPDRIVLREVPARGGPATQGGGARRGDDPPPRPQRAANAAGSDRRRRGPRRRGPGHARRNDDRS